jgi:two-component system, NarL family, sensor histidine kinase UhpB
VLAVNAGIVILGVLLVAFTPITVSQTATPRQLLILASGAAVMVVANAILLKLSLAPLERLTDEMRRVDVLDPGRRLDAAGSAEVAAVIAAFNAALDGLEDERRSSVRRVLSAQEAERRRIAQELHDQIGQNLTAVVLELRRLRSLLPESDGEILADAQELARESLDDLRRISYGLRPIALDDLGLRRAIAALADGVAQRTGIDVQAQTPGELPDLTADEELAIYRIAQEALTNAVRHSGCSRVEISLVVDGGAVRLRVCDDGSGIAATSAGGGIRGMRERALTVGGRMHIQSRPEGGTNVTLRMPARAAGQ